jgi:uncharacterized protein
MSAGLPESVDVWRAAGSGRIYSGSVELARLARLLPSLADAGGVCEFEVAFGRDASGFSEARVVAEAELPLQCQRSLERFLLPVRVEQRLGLIRDESEEAGLPPDVEPALVPADGMMHLLDLVEDELILAVPVLPVKPDSAPVEREFTAAPEETAAANPFAALSALKSPH